MQSSQDNSRVDIAQTLAHQSSQMMTLFKELESVRNLVLANNNRDERADMKREVLEHKRKADIYRAVSIILFFSCILLFLLAI